jgi:hypothetical protein
MESVKWNLLATAALASLVFVLTIQQQNAAAFNDEHNLLVINNHDHSTIPASGDITSNQVHVTNDGTSHYNDNFNSNRGEMLKSNSVTKPIQP